MRRILWLGLALLGAGCGSEWTLEDLDGDGFTWLSGDCDDDDATINPVAVELCDGIDTDCDGVEDPSDAQGALEWYGDRDGDGFAGSEIVVSACEQPQGYALTWDDCDDSNGGINLDALEYCDGVDNNCDGTVDEPAARDAVIWYLDADGDGYAANNAESLRACDPPSGYVEPRGDCNDTDPEIYPDADELPDDGIDSDCDGVDG